ncbi:PEPxxWA-CTERM sorting domain-containing protein [Parasphingorhabdus sp.]|uniref:PEPxxWA-CTERM sorting domain-containing protein n=1 Tax=Parasphingorhabdus sp. TaxID=2709688 RepID=UPI0032655C3E
MKKLILAAALCTTGLSATSASAALFVSGDSNILNVIGSNSANQAFFSNIVEGTNVVVQNSTRTFLNTQATNTVNFYNGNGFAASLFGANDEITAGDLAGVDLYIAFARNNAFTTDETTVLANYLAGGGNVLLTGENSDPDFNDLNALLNVVLTDLGSGMQIAPATLDGGGFATANLLGPSLFLTGTTGFEYAATSGVTGGTALFGTESSNTAFLSFEGMLNSAVPEPATWAFMIFGFGAIGSAMRKQKKANVKVSYA